MKKKKLAWEIYPSFLIVILFSLTAVSWYSARTIRRDYYERVEGELHSAVGILTEAIKPYYPGVKPDAVDELCKRLAAGSRYRITVINISGKVVGDSEEDFNVMDNHGGRDEVVMAMAEGTGKAKRFSRTLSKSMMYVARLVESGEEGYIVRAALPLAYIDSALRTIHRSILMAGIAIATAAALMSILVARKISRPLVGLRQRTEMVSSGSPLEHIPSSKVEEIDSLAQSINQMVDRLHTLEMMRQDFVANVSHELKTPITSIKGFTETLLDGAMHKKEDLERFLMIIDRQSGRLQSIVEDLLVLSSIEHDSDKNEIEFQRGNVTNVMVNAVQACRSKVAKKNVEIRLKKKQELKASVNVQLLEQALVNLIDNAVKYSEAGTLVEVGGRIDGEEIVLSVEDQGPGINAQHLERLFERFYRVDKGRSRSLGGTGLGLAIVKRIAIAHGGRVEVRSEPGRGSVFSLILPIGKC